MPNLIRPAVTCAGLAVVAAFAFGSSGCSNTGASSDDPAGMSRADADMQAVLAEHAELGPKAIETLSAEEARQQPTPADAVMALLKEQGKTPPAPKLASTKTVQVPGGEGEVPAVVYTPQGAGPFPVIVYFHGGGFVIADPKVYEASAQALAEMSGAVVVSVDYRRAPEHPFPAAHEDAYAATQHVMNNAASMNGDPARVAVAGESAGGNLATAVCLMARDRGGKMPVHQLLVYPVANNDMGTESYVENAQAKPLNKAMMGWFFEKYAPTPPTGEMKGYLLPLQAQSLKGLPPATVITAEIDPLRTEGKQYADKLDGAGVDVAHRNYECVTHEFFGMAAAVKDAKDAQKFATDRLKTAFRK